MLSLITRILIVFSLLNFTMPTVLSKMDEAAGMPLLVFLLKKTMYCSYQKIS